MSFTMRDRAYLLFPTILTLILTQTSPTLAQQQGDVRISPASPSTLQSLDNLEQLLLASPKEADRLNVFVIPQYKRERFEVYTETGELFLGPEEFVTDLPAEVKSPDFTVDSVGVALGADYLINSEWLIGGQFNYTHADFDYDTPPESSLLEFVPFRDEGFGNAYIGDPVDRQFDEYGFSISGGYLSDPWTAILTIGYSRRNNETRTRKTSAFFDDGVDTEINLGNAASFQILDADFDSNIYFVDLGGSYRWRYSSVSVAALCIDWLSGRNGRRLHGRVCFRQTPFNEPDDPFVDIDRDRFVNDATAEVDDQTIRSIPGRIGVLVSSPVTPDALKDEEVTSPLTLRTGLSFTHDFSDQKRDIRSVSNLNPEVEDGVELKYSPVYEEENRNRNIFSLIAALRYDFSAVYGALSYQRDFGLDERESADIVSLQIHVPF